MELSIRYNSNKKEKLGSAWIWATNEKKAWSSEIAQSELLTFKIGLELAEPAWTYWLAHQASNAVLSSMRYMRSVEVLRVGQLYSFM